ncbi:Origin recognition complex, subunit 1, partial [Cryomyces antarcticus]
MSLKRKRTTAETARRYLSGGGVLREDSDDELGLDDLPWEWMYDEQKAIHEVQGKQEKSKRRNQPAAGPCIVGARMGSFE